MRCHCISALLFHRHCGFLYLWYTHRSQVVIVNIAGFLIFWALSLYERQGSEGVERSWVFTGYCPLILRADWSEYEEINIMFGGLPCFC